MLRDYAVQKVQKSLVRSKVGDGYELALFQEFRANTNDCFPSDAGFECAVMRDQRHHILEPFW